MARDSGGTYTRVSNTFSNPVANTTIDPTDADALFDEVQTEITDSLCRSGKGSMLANLSMGGFAISTASSVQFAGSSSGFTVLRPAAAASGTLTLPAATDTLVGKATTDILTNKTFDTAGTGNSFSINGTAISAVTGTGAAVLATSPSLTTPTIGVATATTINKVTITAPASAATLTLIDGTTLTGPAASGTVMTLGNTETVTGIKTFGSAGAVGRLKIAGTTSGSTVLDATAVASGTLTLPAATDTLVGKATTDIFTNKTFNSSATGNVLQVSGVTVSAGQYPGTTTNDNATAGNVGEYVESVIASGSAVSLTSSTAKTVTSISLTAGDWDIDSVLLFNTASTTSVTVLGGGISTTNNTLDLTTGRYVEVFMAATVPGALTNAYSLSLPPYRLSLSGTTTVYAVVFATFTVAALTSHGILRARRVR